MNILTSLFILLSFNLYAQVRKVGLYDGNDLRGPLPTSFSDCTGFLVSPDILVTARHCVQNQVHCDQYQWVFGTQSYYTFNDEKLRFMVSEKRKCQKILAEDKFQDYSFIKLNKPVAIEPISIPKRIHVPEAIYMLGSTLGSPLISSGRGRIFKHNHQFYWAAIDSFKGGSGSPVFSDHSGELIGMMIAGSQDLEFNEQRQCYQYFRCRAGSCDGERILRSSVIHRVLQSIK